MHLCVYPIIDMCDELFYSNLTGHISGHAVGVSGTARVDLKSWCVPIFSTERIDVCIRTNIVYTYAHIILQYFRHNELLYV